MQIDQDSTGLDTCPPFHPVTKHYFHLLFDPVFSKLRACLSFTDIKEAVKNCSNLEEAISAQLCADELLNNKSLPKNFTKILINILTRKIIVHTWSSADKVVLPADLIWAIYISRYELLIDGIGLDCIPLTSAESIKIVRQLPKPETRCLFPIVVKSLNGTIIDILHASGDFICGYSLGLVATTYVIYMCEVPFDSSYILSSDNRYRLDNDDGHIPVDKCLSVTIGDTTHYYRLGDEFIKGYERGQEYSRIR